jgi:hypothetical protein
MGLDLSYEQLLNDEEILSTLVISQEDLNKLENQGLLFIRIGESHFYLGSTLLTFLKGIEGKPERRVRPRKNTEVEAPMDQPRELSGE